MSHDPRALLLTVAEVAARLGWPERKVRAAIHATSPDQNPPPMRGWVNAGSPTRPQFRLSEAALIDYIETMPEA